MPNDEQPSNDRDRDRKQDRDHDRIVAVEMQMQRIIAHLESEGALYRRDINRLERELFGNGQPGQLSIMSARIARVERFMFMLAGGIAVVAGSMALILYSMEHLK